MTSLIEMPSELGTLLQKSVDETNRTHAARKGNGRRPVRGGSETFRHRPALPLIPRRYWNRTPTTEEPKEWNGYAVSRARCDQSTKQAPTIVPSLEPAGS
jgi:hypothetical protein